jgi:hypothetical protein
MFSGPPKLLEHKQIGHHEKASGYKPPLPARDEISDNDEKQTDSE